MARRQPAALRRYWAKHRSHRSHKGRKKYRHVARRHVNPHRRHRRRNPISFGLGGVTNKIMPAVIGAGAALGADLILQKTPLGSYVPSMFTTGYLKYVPRAAAVFLSAWVLGKVKPSWRNEALAGGLAVVAYSLLKDIANGVGGMQLADYDDVPDYSTLGYMSPGTQLGAYMGNRPPVLASYMGAGRPPVLAGYQQNYPDAAQPMGTYMLSGVGDYNTANLD